MSFSFCLEVSGEFACFTRPEMKVERVSYDVITPSAARAIGITDWDSEDEGGDASGGGGGGAAAAGRTAPRPERARPG